MTSSFSRPAERPPGSCVPTSGHAAPTRRPPESRVPTSGYAAPLAKADTVIPTARLAFNPSASRAPFTVNPTSLPFTPFLSPRQPMPHAEQCVASPRSPHFVGPHVAHVRQSHALSDETQLITASPAHRAFQSARHPAPFAPPKAPRTYAPGDVRAHRVPSTLQHERVDKVQHVDSHRYTAELSTVPSPSPAKVLEENVFRRSPLPALARETGVNYRSAVPSQFLRSPCLMSRGINLQSPGGIGVGKEMLSARSDASAAMPSDVCAPDPRRPLPYAEAKSPLNDSVPPLHADHIHARRGSEPYIPSPALLIAQPSHASARRSSVPRSPTSQLIHSMSKRASDYGNSLPLPQFSHDLTTNTRSVTTYGINCQFISPSPIGIGLSGNGHMPTTLPNGATRRATFPGRPPLSGSRPRGSMFDPRDTPGFDLSRSSAELSLHSAEVPRGTRPRASTLSAIDAPILYCPPLSQPANIPPLPLRPPLKVCRTLVSTTTRTRWWYVNKPTDSGDIVEETEEKTNAREEHRGAESQQQHLLPTRNPEQARVVNVAENTNTVETKNPTLVRDPVDAQSACSHIHESTHMDTLAHSNDHMEGHGLSTDALLHDTAQSIVHDAEKKVTRTTLECVKEETTAWPIDDRVVVEPATGAGRDSAGERHDTSKHGVEASQLNVISNVGQRETSHELRSAAVQKEDTVNSSAVQKEDTVNSSAVQKEGTVNSSASEKGVSEPEPEGEYEGSGSVRSPVKLNEAETAQHPADGLDKVHDRTERGFEKENGAKDAQPRVNYTDEERIDKQCRVVIDEESARMQGCLQIGEETTDAPVDGFTGQTSDSVREANLMNDRTMLRNGDIEKGSAAPFCGELTENFGLHSAGVEADKSNRGHAEASDSSAISCEASEVADAAEKTEKRKEEKGGTKSARFTGEARSNDVASYFGERGDGRASSHALEDATEVANCSQGDGSLDSQSCANSSKCDIVSCAANSFNWENEKTIDGSHSPDELKVAIEPRNSKDNPLLVPLKLISGGEPDGVCNAARGALCSEVKRVASWTALDSESVSEVLSNVEKCESARRDVGDEKNHGRDIRLISVEAKHEVAKRDHIPEAFDDISKIRYDSGEKLDATDDSLSHEKRNEVPNSTWDFQQEIVCDDNEGNFQKECDTANNALGFAQEDEHNKRAVVRVEDIFDKKCDVARREYSSGDEFDFTSCPSSPECRHPVPNHVSLSEEEREVTGKARSCEKDRSSASCCVCSEDDYKIPGTPDGLDSIVAKPEGVKIEDIFEEGPHEGKTPSCDEERDNSIAYSTSHRVHDVLNRALGSEGGRTFASTSGSFGKERVGPTRASGFDEYGTAAIGIQAEVEHEDTEVKCISDNTYVGAEAESSSEDTRGPTRGKHDESKIAAEVQGECMKVGSTGNMDYEAEDVSNTLDYQEKHEPRDGVGSAKALRDFTEFERISGVEYGNVAAERSLHEDRSPAKEKHEVSSILLNSGRDSVVSGSACSSEKEQHGENDTCGFHEKHEPDNVRITDAERDVREVECASQEADAVSDAEAKSDEANAETARDPSRSQFQCLVSGSEGDFEHEGVAVNNTSGFQEEYNAGDSARSGVAELEAPDVGCSADVEYESAEAARSSDEDCCVSRYAGKCDNKQHMDMNTSGDDEEHEVWASPISIEDDNEVTEVECIVEEDYDRMKARTSVEDGRDTAERKHDALKSLAQSKAVTELWCEAGNFESECVEENNTRSHQHEYDTRNSADSTKLEYDIVKGECLSDVEYDGADAERGSDDDRAPIAGMPVMPKTLLQSEGEYEAQSIVGNSEKEPYISTKTPSHAENHGAWAGPMKAQAVREAAEIMRISAPDCDIADAGCKTDKDHDAMKEAFEVPKTTRLSKGECEVQSIVDNTLNDGREYRVWASADGATASERDALEVECISETDYEMADVECSFDMDYFTAAGKGHAFSILSPSPGDSTLSSSVDKSGKPEKPCRSLSDDEESKTRIVDEESKTRIVGDDEESKTTVACGAQAEHKAADAECTFDIEHNAAERNGRSEENISVTGAKHDAAKTWLRSKGMQEVCVRAGNFENEDANNVLWYEKQKPRGRACGANAAHAAETRCMSGEEYDVAETERYSDDGRAAPEGKYKVVLSPLGSGGRHEAPRKSEQEHDNANNMWDCRAERWMGFSLGSTRSKRDAVKVENTSDQDRGAADAERSSEVGRRAVNIEHRVSQNPLNLSGEYEFLRRPGTCTKKRDGVSNGATYDEERGTGSNSGSPCAKGVLIDAPQGAQCFDEDCFTRADGVSENLVDSKDARTVSRRASSCEKELENAHNASGTHEERYETRYGVSSACAIHNCAELQCISDKKYGFGKHSGSPTPLRSKGEHAVSGSASNSEKERDIAHDASSYEKEHKIVCILDSGGVKLRVAEGACISEDDDVAAEVERASEDDHAATEGNHEASKAPSRKEDEVSGSASSFEKERDGVRNVPDCEEEHETVSRAVVKQPVAEVECISEEDFVVTEAERSSHKDRVATEGKRDVPKILSRGAVEVSGIASNSGRLLECRNNATDYKEELKRASGLDSDGVNQHIAEVECISENNGVVAEAERSSDETCFTAKRKDNVSKRPSSEKYEVSGGASTLRKEHMCESDASGYEEEHESAFSLNSGRVKQRVAEVECISEDNDVATKSERSFEDDRFTAKRNCDLSNTFQREYEIPGSVSNSGKKRDDVRDVSGYEEEHKSAYSLDSGDVKQGVVEVERSSEEDFGVTEAERSSREERVALEEMREVPTIPLRGAYEVSGCKSNSGRPLECANNASGYEEQQHESLSSLDSVGVKQRVAEVECISEDDDVVAKAERSSEDDRFFTEGNCGLSNTPSQGEHRVSGSASNSEKELDDVRDISGYEEEHENACSLESGGIKHVTAEVERSSEEDFVVTEAERSSREDRVALEEMREVPTIPPRGEHEVSGIASNSGRPLECANNASGYEEQQHESLSSLNSVGVKQRVAEVECISEDDDVVAEAERSSEDDHFATEGNCGLSNTPSQGEHGVSGSASNSEKERDDVRDVSGYEEEHENACSLESGGIKQVTAEVERSPKEDFVVTEAERSSREDRVATKGKHEVSKISSHQEYEVSGCTSNSGKECENASDASAYEQANESAFSLDSGRVKQYVAEVGRIFEVDDVVAEAEHISHEDCVTTEGKHEVSHSLSHQEYEVSGGASNSEKELECASDASGYEEECESGFSCSSRASKPNVTKGGHISEEKYPAAKADRCSILERIPTTKKRKKSEIRSGIKHHCNSSSEASSAKERVAKNNSICCGKEPGSGFPVCLAPAEEVVMKYDYISEKKYEGADSDTNSEDERYATEEKLDVAQTPADPKGNCEVSNSGENGKLEREGSKDTSRSDEEYNIAASAGRARIDHEVAMRKEHEPHARGLLTSGDERTDEDVQRPRADSRKEAGEPHRVCENDVNREVVGGPLHSHVEHMVREPYYSCSDALARSASDVVAERDITEEDDCTHGGARADDVHVATDSRHREEARDATPCDGRHTGHAPKSSVVPHRSDAPTDAASHRAEQRDVLTSPNDRDSTRWSTSSEEQIATGTREARAGPVRRPLARTRREIDTTVVDVPSSPSPSVQKFTRPVKKLNETQKAGQELAKWERFRRHTLDKAKEILRRRLRPRTATGTEDILMAQTQELRGKRGATINSGQIPKLFDGNRDEDHESRRVSVGSSFRSTNSGVESYRNVRAAAAIFEGKIAFRNRTRCSTDTAGELWREVVRAASKFDLEEWKKQK